MPIKIILTQTYRSRPGAINHGDDSIRILVDMPLVEYKDFKARNLVEKSIEEEIHPCPECGSKLYCAAGGGLYCKKCDYWFCY